MGWTPDADQKWEGRRTQANGLTQASPGQRPGNRASKGSSPERAIQIACRADVPPLQGLRFSTPFPRALPWAGMGQAVGLQIVFSNFCHTQRSDLFRWLVTHAHLSARGEITVSVRDRASGGGRSFCRPRRRRARRRGSSGPRPRSGSPWRWRFLPRAPRRCRSPARR